MIRRGINHFSDNLQDTNAVPYAKGFQASKSKCKFQNLNLSQFLGKHHYFLLLLLLVPSAVSIPTINDVEDAIGKALLKMVERVCFFVSFPLFSS
jgi:hypothetical protein